MRYSSCLDSNPRLGTHTINCHLKKVFADSELEEEAVIRNFRITASDGKIYNTKHYKLAATIAIGHKKIDGFRLD